MSAAASRSWLGGRCCCHCARHGGAGSKHVSHEMTLAVPGTFTLLILTTVNQAAAALLLSPIAELPTFELDKSESDSPSG